MRQSPEAGRKGQTRNRAAIMTIFMATGVAAGSTNRRRELRIAEKNAVRQIKNIYGNMICRRLRINAIRGLSGRITSAREASRIPVATNAARVRLRNENMLEANCQTFSRPCFSRVSVKTGTKAEDSAPSPNKLRKRLGMRKATTKASMAKELPKKAAMAISRTRPKARLSKIKKPTMPAERMIFFLSKREGPPG